MLSHLILSHSNNLSRTLQCTDTSASEGQNVAKMTVKVLESLRTEVDFTFFWSNECKLEEEKFGYNGAKLTKKT